MSLIDDMGDWLKTIIPQEYVPRFHRWVDSNEQANNRMWCLYQNNGNVQGTFIARPAFRLVIFGARQDTAVQDLSELAELINNTAINSTTYPEAGCLCHIAPIGWVSPVGYTEEQRPFIELNFDTIRG